MEVKNTIAFVFPGDAAQPSLADVARFVKEINGDHAMMETVYKISDEKSIFIRFKTEGAMKFSLEQNPELLAFHYSDGKSVTVRMSMAGETTRYVRVFDLPPEISDQDLSSVLCKYGRIRRVVRERFPAEFQLDMFTGIRGLYMEVEKEIPDVLYFRHRKGRIYYDGKKLRCYRCQSDTHLKRSCPLLMDRRGEQATQQNPATDAEVEKEKKDEKAGMDGAVSGECKQPKEKLKKKVKKSETKRQRSSDSDVEKQAKKKNEVNPQSSESDSSIIADPDLPSVRRRFKVPSYEWIEDQNERQQLMEEDKSRIAAAYNIAIDLVDVYYDNY